MPDAVLAESSEARSRQFLADITEVFPVSAPVPEKRSSLAGCPMTPSRR